MAVDKLQSYPTDWHRLKELLHVCAIKLWNEQELTQAIMTLELHLPGKFKWKRRKGGYSPRRIRYQRGILWVGRVTFNSQTQETVVDNCQFIGPLMRLASDYYAERGIQYRAPSLTPKEHMNLNDPKTLLMDPSVTRYADYSQKPHPPYDLVSQTKKRGEGRGIYVPARVEVSYMPEGQRTREEELRAKRRIHG